MKKTDLSDKNSSFISDRLSYMLPCKDYISIPAERTTNSELTSSQQTLLEKRMKKRAYEAISIRIQYYEGIIPVHHKKLTIRDQKTRWGSCSSSGTLSFNWRLILAPPEILDYVVVHELCHFLHMDHSKAFWKEVETVLPDYKLRRKWLKDNGRSLTIQVYSLNGQKSF